MLEIEELLSEADMSVFTNGTPDTCKQLGLFQINSYHLSDPSEIVSTSLSDINILLDTALWSYNKGLITQFHKGIYLTDRFASNHIWRVSSKQCWMKYVHMLQEIGGLIHTPGMICLDIADVRTVLNLVPQPSIGIGKAIGVNCAAEACKHAISDISHNPLNSKGCLVNIRGAISLKDFSTVGEIIESKFNEDVIIAIGNAFDSSQKGEIMVSILA